MLFWLGALLIVCGVAAHLPMYWMGRHNGFVLSGMAMDLPMLIGMAAIPLGVALAFVALLPEGAFRTAGRPAPAILVEEGEMSAIHVKVVLALLFAVTVDVMKPATLGFVIPGLRVEYGLEQAGASFIALAGLGGTAVGSILWGWLGDVIGRRGAILLSVMMFMGTSICGAMPSFGWNIAMCFLMGMSAGGMLPIAFALTAEILPARHRGWLLVALGGIGTAAGYMVASGAAALLAPLFSWRSLWLIGFPTGIALLLMQRYIPESPRFLSRIGDDVAARATLDRFGGRLAAVQPDARTTPAAGVDRLFGGAYTLIALALVGTGLAWGLVNIGFLLWLPSTLETLGLPRETVSKLLAVSGMLSLPCVLLVIPLYHRWSSFGTAVGCTVLTGVGLLVFAVFGQSGGTFPIVASVALVLVASSGTIATLVPYASEVFPLSLRSTGTGLVAAATKLGGLAGAGIGALGLFRAIDLAAIALAVPLFLFAFLLHRSGVDTRGRSLEDIQRDFQRPAG